MSRFALALLFAASGAFAHGTSLSRRFFTVSLATSRATASSRLAQAASTG